MTAATSQRVQVTLTDELRAAVELARQAWPDLPTSQLVAALAVRGANSVDLHTERRARRRELVAAHAGCLTGVYHSGEMVALRSEWPA